MNNHKKNVQKTSTEDIGFNSQTALHNIIFYSSKNNEVIKIHENGEFYIHGKLVTEDIEIYNAFVKFFIDAGCYTPTKKGKI